MDGRTHINVRSLRELSKNVNVYGVVITAVATARVHPVCMMNAVLQTQHKITVSPYSKSTDFSCESGYGKD